MAPEPLGYVLLAASLFLSLLAALALAVLLAAYTKDVRSAQSLLGVLFLPIFLPAFVLMFAPLEIMPVAFQGTIYAIPFSYPILASKALYTKEYLAVALGIAYQAAFSVAAVGLAGRLFASEKILTARLRIGRKRSRGAAEEP
jgi:ABC-2 type transport system permease protein